MANLFIGFPVPRAKIATMIETAAPPLEHAENHFPDGSDPVFFPADISEGQILVWDGAKFVGSDAPAAGAYPSPISIHPSQFTPLNDTKDFIANQSGLRTRTSLDLVWFYAPVRLPHGAVVTKMTVYAYRDDADSSMSLYLYRVDNLTTYSTMSNISIDWTSGNSDKFDDSIDYETIDNSLYSYCLGCSLNSNDSAGDLKLINVKIDFT